MKIGKVADFGTGNSIMAFRLTKSTLIIHICHFGIKQGQL